MTRGWTNQPDGRAASWRLVSLSCVAFEAAQIIIWTIAQLNQGKNSLPKPLRCGRALHQLSSPSSFAHWLWMFARKPNPTLTLIQGQRNSCNLSLYLLGSLFPFSLPPSHLPSLPHTRTDCFLCWLLPFSSALALRSAGERQWTLWARVQNGGEKEVPQMWLSSCDCWGSSDYVSSLLESPMRVCSGGSGAFSFQEHLPSAAS